MIMEKHALKGQITKVFISENTMFYKEDCLEDISCSIEIKEQKEIIGIPKQLVLKIKERLKAFECNRGFLEHQITLISTAKGLDTNSTYLSKVINETREKNFANYINDLRIEYAIRQLKLNPKYRRYSIAAIASEVGFSNTKSFSRAFLKKTTKQASIFIKELE